MEAQQIIKIKEMLTQENFLTNLKNYITNENIEIQNTTNYVQQYTTNIISTIEEQLSDKRMYDARMFTVDLLADLNSFYETKEVAKECISKMSLFTSNDKRILIDSIFEEDNVSKFLISKTKKINNFDKLSNEEMTDFIEKIILSEELRKNLHKKYPLSEENSSFYIFFENLISNVLPSLNYENIGKLYGYTLSGHLFKDFQDEKFLEIYKNKNTDKLIEELMYRVKDKQIGLFSEQTNKSDDYSIIWKELSLPEGYKKNVFRVSPAGCYDYFIQDSKNEKLFYGIQIQAITRENDIYEHARKAAIVDRSLVEFKNRQGFEIQFLDVQKGHSIDYIKKQYINNDSKIKSSDIIEIQRITDTLLNSFLYQQNGIYKTVVTVGVNKYNEDLINKSNPYDDFHKLVNYIAEDKIKIESKNSDITKLVYATLKAITEDLKTNVEFFKNMDNLVKLQESVSIVSEKFDRHSDISNASNDLQNVIEFMPFNYLKNQAVLNKTYNELRWYEKHFSVLEASQNGDQSLVLKESLNSFGLGLTRLNYIFKDFIETDEKLEKSLKIIEKFAKETYLSDLLINNESNKNLLKDLRDSLIYIKNKDTKYNEEVSIGIEEHIEKLNSFENSFLSRKSPLIKVIDRIELIKESMKELKNKKKISNMSDSIFDLSDIQNEYMKSIGKEKVIDKRLRTKNNI